MTNIDEFDVEEIEQLYAELAAVDASLGEFYIPARDPETDEPGGAFYQDHGVWIVVEELAKARAEMAQLQTRLVGSQEINASLTHFVLETQAEAVRLQGELDRANGELAARDYAILLAAVELVRQQDEVARLHKVNAALVAAMKMVRDYIARVHGEGLPRGAFGPVQLYQIMDGAVEGAR